jgi:hypothetical protein
MQQAQEGLKIAPNFIIRAISLPKIWQCFIKFHVGLSHYDQKTKLRFIIVDAFRELTLYFVSPCFWTQPSRKHVGHRASTVNGMQSGQRAGNVHWKHGSHRADRAEIKQSDHPAGSMLGKLMNRRNSTGQEHNFKKRSSSSSNTKHYEQSVLPKQASVTCMCASMWTYCQHCSKRQRTACGSSKLNSEKQ